MSAISCDDCVNLTQDPETGEDYCAVELDEDEMLLFITGRQRACPYYRPGDEYDLVKKQN